MPYRLCEIHKKRGPERLKQLAKKYGRKYVEELQRRGSNYCRAYKHLETAQNIVTSSYLQQLPFKDRKLGQTPEFNKLLYPFIMQVLPKYYGLVIVQEIKRALKE